MARFLGELPAKDSGVDFAIRGCVIEPGDDVEAHPINGEGEGRECCQSWTIGRSSTHYISDDGGRGLHSVPVIR